MFVIFMALTTMAGLFAYEPKKECFEVYRDTVFYAEKVRVEDDVLYDSILLDDNRCFTRYLTIDLGDLEYAVEINYLKLLLNRNRVEHLKKEKESLSFNTKEERKLYIELDQRIEKEINEAVYEIPFVTRENFYKISKRKYEKTFIKYMRKIQKEALEKEALEKEELQPLRKLVKIENK